MSLITPAHIPGSALAGASQPSLSVLLTLSDGQDTRDSHDYERDCAARELREAGVVSLSCAIGTKDVTHEGLVRIAAATGGLHVASESSLTLVRSGMLLAGYLETEVISRTETAASPNLFYHRDEIHISQRSGRRPLDLFVLLDCSLSMVGMRKANDYSGDHEKLARAKEVAKAFLARLNPEMDRAGVARFHALYERLQAFTRDMDACVRAVDRIGPMHGTGLYRAMQSAAKEFNLNPA